MNRRTTVVTLAVAMLALTACSAAEDDALPVSTPSVTQEAEPTSTPTPTPAPESERGSRANPLAPGEARLVGADSAFTVSGGVTTFDAWPAVQAENEFNEPPVEGRQFVMFPLTVAVDWPTIQKQADEGLAEIDAGINPMWSLTVKYVGSDGTSYGSGPDDYCGVVPDDWSSTQAVFDSATVAGNFCVSVPSAVAQGGTWVVTNVANDAVFIAATA
ncbi:hypothetical protein AB6N24_06165 [Cellulomonas sp. 179-A 4D5 NHS]|uniref:hypothetical protein n=1 Tax=Cellulomonas sp. 179-A 4D5 NHS TaxID=3142378 RepID=UPI00399FE87B